MILGMAFLRLLLLLPGSSPSRLPHRTSLQPENVDKVNHRFIRVRDTRLTALSHPNEGKVGQLPTQGGEGGVVEVYGEDLRLDPVTIVDDNFAVDDFVWQYFCAMES